MVLINNLVEWRITLAVNVRKYYMFNDLYLSDMVSVHLYSTTSDSSFMYFVFCADYLSEFRDCSIF